MIGLRFFPPGTPAPKRRKRWLFVAVYILAVLALIWPVCVIVSRGTLAGWPMALAWNVFWLVVVLVALGILYMKDR